MKKLLFYPTTLADSTAMLTAAQSATEVAIISFFIFTYFLGSLPD